MVNWATYHPCQRISNASQRLPHVYRCAPGACIHAIADTQRNPHAITDRRFHASALSNRDIQSNADSQASAKTVTYSNTNVNPYSSDALSDANVDDPWSPDLHS